MTTTSSPTTRAQARAPHAAGWLALLVLALASFIVILIVRSTDLGSGSTLQGSGIAVRQARAVAAFSGVDLAGSNNVAIRVGRPRSVVVHADDNLVGRVTTRVEAGTLVIDTKGSFAAKSPMSVTVTVPALSTLKLSGSGTVEARGIRAPRFTVALSGSGIVQAAGTAARLTVTLGGSGDAELRGLVAADVTASVGGSGQILLTATDALDASIAGSGTISYAGSPPQVRESVTGSGAITRA